MTENRGTEVSPKAAAASNEPAYDIGRAALARARGTSSALSPAARRGLVGSVRVQRARALAVSGSMSGRLLDRIARRSEHSTVWQPQAFAGKLVASDAFAENVVQRFPDVSAKYQREQGGPTTDKSASAMPLQGSTAAASVESQPVASAFSAPRFSISAADANAADKPSLTQQLQRMVEASRPPSAAQAAPKPQPATATDDAPTVAAQNRDSGKRLRRFTRVDVMNTDSGKSNTSGPAFSASMDRVDEPPVTPSATRAPAIQRKPVENPTYRPLPRPESTQASQIQTADSGSAGRLAVDAEVQSASLSRQPSAVRPPGVERAGHADLPLRKPERPTPQEVAAPESDVSSQANPPRVQQHVQRSLASSSPDSPIMGESAQPKLRGAAPRAVVQPALDETAQNVATETTEIGPATLPEQIAAAVEPRQGGITASTGVQREVNQAMPLREVERQPHPIDPVNESSDASAESSKPKRSEPGAAGEPVRSQPGGPSAHLQRTVERASAETAADAAATRSMRDPRAPNLEAQSPAARPDASMVPTIQRTMAQAMPLHASMPAATSESVSTDDGAPDSVQPAITSRQPGVQRFAAGRSTTAAVTDPRSDSRPAQADSDAQVVAEEREVVQPVSPAGDDSIQRAVVQPMPFRPLPKAEARTEGDSVLSDSMPAAAEPTTGIPVMPSAQRLSPSTGAPAAKARPAAPGAATERDDRAPARDSRLSTDGLPPTDLRRDSTISSSSDAPASTIAPETAVPVTIQRTIDQPLTLRVHEGREDSAESGSEPTDMLTSEPPDFQTAQGRSDLRAANDRPVLRRKSHEPSATEPMPQPSGPQEADEERGQRLRAHLPLDSRAGGKASVVQRTSRQDLPLRRASAAAIATGRIDSGANASPPGERVSSLTASANAAPLGDQVSSLTADRRESPASASEIVRRMPSESGSELTPDKAQPVRRKLGVRAPIRTGAEASLARVSPQTAPRPMRSLEMPLRNGSKSEAANDGDSAKTGMVTFQNPFVPSQNVIRRTPDTSAGSGTEKVQSAQKPAKTAEVVKREEEERRTQKETADLDEIARKIFPLLKRMLAIERERRSDG